MNNLSRHDAATLVTEGHVYCAGTLAQCLRRWNRLSSENQRRAFLKMGRDGMPATIIDGDKLAELAQMPQLHEGGPR